jgi:hypothetical protein
MDAVRVPQPRIQASINLATMPLPQLGVPSQEAAPSFFLAAAVQR